RRSITTTSCGITGLIIRGSAASTAARECIWGGERPGCRSLGRKAIGIEWRQFRRPISGQDPFGDELACCRGQEDAIAIMAASEEQPLATRDTINDRQAIGSCRTSSTPGAREWHVAQGRYKIARRLGELGAERDVGRYTFRFEQVSACHDLAGAELQNKEF